MSLQVVVCLLFFILGFGVGSLQSRNVKEWIKGKYLFVVQWRFHDEIISFPCTVKYDPEIEQWVATCANLGVVTQGDSLNHAQNMLREALEIIILDDLQQGLDPMDRIKADRECH